jgi:uncharacterized protein YerC
MEFRVVLVANGEYKKTLHKCKTRETAFINFHKIKDENKVLYPKKFINTGGIKPVKFQIYITKPTEEGDSFRLLRDDYGKTYIEEPLGDWTILHSDDYQVEETFWVYGMDSKAERPTISEVVKRLMQGAHGKKMVKQVIVVYNKLIIHNEEQFDMVLCKNLEDAQRLHHTLAKIAKKQKIKSLLFMGTASKAMNGRLYDLIHDETGWSYSKIRRTSTRP